MAARAILRRKKYFFDSLNRPKYLLHCCSSSFEHGSLSVIPDSWDQSRAVRHVSSNSDQGNEAVSDITKHELLTNLARGCLRHNSCRIPTFCRNGTGGFSLGGKWVTEYVRHSSTAAAGQPHPDRGDDKNEEPTVKQKKEASPEECDQAVEGLSTVKAKAKAKQLHDTQKDAKPMIKRIWAMLLGIGPALKAVASMSRLKFGVL